MHAPASPSRRGFGVALAAVTLLALALRLFQLGHQALWLDEAVTWWNATRPTWLGAAFAEPNHPPVWWLVTRASVLLGGESEFMLRLPAALCGTLAVALCGLLARRAFAEPGHPSPDAAALWVALLAASGGFWIEYAQEARMYAALLAESLGLMLLLLRWLERGRARDLVAYAGLAALALLTHVFAVWTLLAHGVFVLGLRHGAAGRPRAIPLRPFLLAQGAAGLVFAAWLVHALGGPHGVSVGGRFNAAERLLYSLWRMGVGPAIAVADRPRIDMGLLAYARTEGPAIAASALLWGVPIGLGAWALRGRPALRWLLATGILVPALGLLFVQPVLPLMHEKYLIAVAPFLLLLAVLGAFAAPAPGRAALLGGLVALELAGLAAYALPDQPLVARALVHGHPYGHEDWRGVCARVDALDPRGTVVLAPAYLDMPWNYYARGRHPIAHLPAPGAPADSLAHAIAPLVGARPVAWIFASDRDVDRARDLAGIAHASGVPVADVERRVELYPRGFGIRVLIWPPAGTGVPAGNPRGS